ncbi:twitching motility protein PilT [Legionella israelensis]|uniref:Twitching motility protein PilT n=1 Tax=Legionella israelensis TaxID=454 RepID=A0AAX1ECR2_9GAMM|nr:Mut7-C RNAse domain-containing protein [Legionella israelensis]QBR82908.1 twitching motility protein PilT [Legionella israelensis]
MNTAFFRFYAALNDFLPEHKRQKEFAYEFAGNPGIKDAIEAIGVPHPEVELILVNGGEVDFDYQLLPNDRISVYPTYEQLKLSAGLLAKPIEPKFILDVHLGRLAKYLRLIGFDCRYDNNLSDAEIVDLAQEEKRIILTRDKGLLKHKKVRRGYWIRNTNSRKQLAEVAMKFDLLALMAPFSRCLECNSKLKEIPLVRVKHLLPEKTQRYYKTIAHCSNCGKYYWQGSHYQRLSRLIDALKNHQI